MQSSGTTAQRAFRYYDIVMAVFVTLLICSNVIGAGKVIQVGGISFGAAVIFFPISYIFGDILTEVYGFARARKVVWMGFAALAFASFVSWVVVALPPAPGWPHQEAYAIAFGSTPRIAAASLVAFCIGEFTNSFTLAKMKVLTDGRHLWTRLLGSTVAGELVDSVIFYPLAFYGNWSNELVIKVMLSNYLFKVIWEMIFTPVTYKVVAFLKQAENEDYYDRDTDFTPFSLKT